MNQVLVVAPHPDDETIGCGGTLLNHKNKGDRINWLIVTAVNDSLGFTKEKIKERELEIQKVTNAYGFSKVNQCEFPTTRLDTIPVANIINKVSGILYEVKPNIVYLPHSGDVHTDHKIVFDVTSSCLKWFRYPFIRRVLSYETLSETEAAFNSGANSFCPNVFVDISPFLDEKLEIMRIYKSELGRFPFPRSEKALCASASFRGAASGFHAAEAFMLLKETIR